MNDNNDIETKKEFLVKKYTEYYEESSEVDKNIKESSVVLSIAIFCLITAVAAIVANEMVINSDNLKKIMDSIMFVTGSVSGVQLYTGFSRWAQAISRKAALENLMENIANRFYINREELDKIAEKVIDEKEFEEKRAR